MKKKQVEINGIPIIDPLPCFVPVSKQGGGINAPKSLKFPWPRNLLQNKGGGLIIGIPLILCIPGGAPTRRGSAVEL